MPCSPGTFGQGDGACSPCTNGTYSYTGFTSSCTPCAAGTHSGPAASSCTPCVPGKFKPVNNKLYPPAGLGDEYAVVSGAPYANGVYRSYFSSADGSGTRQPGKLIYNRIDNDVNIGAWQDGGSVGAPAGDGYSGHWTRLEMPLKVAVSAVRIFNSNARNFRVYGRDSGATPSTWTMLLQVVNAAYASNNELVVAALPTTATYNMLLLVVGTTLWTNSALYMGELTYQEYEFIPSASCTDCIRGTYTTTSGNIACTPCTAGTYSDILGAFTNTTCVKCPAGTFSSAGGASTCTTCAKGAFNPVTGSTVCTTCPLGTAA